MTIKLGIQWRKTLPEQSPHPLEGIRSASQGASTEMPLAQTTVKPFAISYLDSPTFFRWRDNVENGAVIQSKKKSCCTRRSALKFNFIEGR